MLNFTHPMLIYFLLIKFKKNPRPLKYLMENTIQQIQEYFQVKRHEFKFPIRKRGTDSHLKVRKLLSQIPYGTSLT